MYYNKITINGLDVLGDEHCPYAANLYNFLIDSTNTNNDSELYGDGSYSGTYKTNAKQFSMTVITKKENDTKASLQLAHVINQGLIPLMVDIENFGIVECEVKKESITTDDFGLMTISFIIPNGYIYKKKIKELVLERQIEGGFVIPESGFSVPESGFIINEKVIGNIGECINEGFKTIYPEIYIEGDGSYFEIKNKTTNETLIINSFIESQTLYVDCRKESRKIKLIDGKIEKNYLKYKQGDYISLISGSNIIEINYEGEAVVTIKYRECYV